MSIQVIFHDETDQLLWSTASALQYMVASNHKFGRDAWEAFKRELTLINECVPYHDEQYEDEKIEIKGGTK